ncbi:hypothetical protein BJ165DRAFT_1358855 [Panaeolus papilionaceus]|nr:hypothetical protein BJ165DRAFT_1358855 [Panaeolus papilionaceus]
MDCGNSCNDDPRRSLFSIIWGCATTLFACTYVAIHPNVSFNETGTVVLARRMGLAMAMILTPELVVYWALQQRLLAHSLCIMHEDKGWTLRHAFFLIMGGFSYYDESGTERTLDYTTLKYLHASEKLQWPTAEIISEDEIKDRSKADAVTKIIVLIHILWFCIQYLTRLIIHMEVLELESAIFAYGQKKKAVQ